MKTTKSFIVILFALLTAQVAFAWYDPSTQRWLNQDPIQEMGGINLYEYVDNYFIDECDL
ncbi:MAG: RHS repeat-associated core domain-containing protein [Limisphaerales bacterium]